MVTTRVREKFRMLVKLRLRDRTVFGCCLQPGIDLGSE